MSVPKLAEIHNVNILNAGWSTRSNRFYPKQVLRSIESQFSTPSLGDLIFSGDGADLRMDLANVSHRTNRIYLKNDDTELWAEVQLLDNKCGRIVKDLLKTDSVYFGCSMAGFLNKHDEVEPDGVEFVRVTAFGYVK